MECQQEGSVALHDCARRTPRSHKQSPKSDFLYWHWSPRWVWQIHHPLIGFNEVMITYLLAIASPTHGVPAQMYYTGWANQSEIGQNYRQGWSGSADGNHYWNRQAYFGIELHVGVGTGGPLFFTHYSFLGFDPHSLHDAYTSATYFENNRNIARISLAYSIPNPKHFQGYGANAWGLTASDGAYGYVPHSPDNDHDWVRLRRLERLHRFLTPGRHRWRH